MLNFVLLAASLALTIQGADFAIQHCTKLASRFSFSKHIVGFLIVAVVSILPEAIIALTSALKGQPAFGLGTLLGSNVADLTLIIAIIVLVSSHDVHVKSHVLKMNFLYIVAMTLPVVFGMNGEYSRIEGVLLIAAGVLFYFFVFKKDVRVTTVQNRPFTPKHGVYLMAGIALLLIGSYFSVQYGVALAEDLGVGPMLIGMFIVSIGTALPELIFSIRAVKRHHDELALGDILGTVISDATIVLGVVALVHPFSFNPRLIYITGIFMVGAALLLFHMMKTGKAITKREGVALLLFYGLFIAVELTTSYAIL